MIAAPFPSDVDDDDWDDDDEWADEESEAGGQEPPWKVLVVDDDPEIHSVTSLVLDSITYNDRGVELISAYSAEEATAVMRGRQDIAVALLDVVMETEDAGLRLTRIIREELGNTQVRIILRTGQPGQAPERDVIVNYDINDYKAKTELTAQKLFTATIAALRAYEDIVTIERSKRGLEMIIEASASLFRTRSLRLFAEGVLTQLAAMLEFGEHAILCASQVTEDNGAHLYEMAASGRYKELGDGPIEGSLEERARAAIEAAIAAGKSQFLPDGTALFIGEVKDRFIVAYIDTGRPIDEFYRKLLEVFCMNLAVALDNVYLYELLEQENERLKERVEERTAELRQSLEQLQQRQTQLVRAEKLASLGELTAGIAHEIRNPLNFVNNFAKLSVDLASELGDVLEPAKAHLDAESHSDLDEITADLTANLSKIAEHGDRANRIVQGMLSHARMDKADKEEVDVNRLLREAMLLAQHGTARSDRPVEIVFDCRLDEDVPTIEAVATDLSRVFLNLLNNAVYAVDERARLDGAGFEPRILVSSRRTDSGIELSVQDNGTGMPADVREKIFEPFFTTKPTDQGTGLGLSMSYDIVTGIHEGQMSVDSEPGSHTEFRIELPVR